MAITPVLQVGLAGYLLIGAVAKAQVQGLPPSLAGFVRKWPRFEAVAWPAVALAEAALAVSLLVASRGSVRVPAVLTFGAMLLFLGVTIDAFRRGTSCGCFGSLRPAARRDVFGAFLAAAAGLLLVLLSFLQQPTTGLGSLSIAAGAVFALVLSLCRWSFAGTAERSREGEGMSRRRLLRIATVGGVTMAASPALVRASASSDAPASVEEIMSQAGITLKSQAEADLLAARAAIDPTMRRVLVSAGIDPGAVSWDGAYGASIAAGDTFQNDWEYVAVRHGNGMILWVPHASLPSTAQIGAPDPGVYALAVVDPARGMHATGGFQQTPVPLVPSAVIKNLDCASGVCAPDARLGPCEDCKRRCEDAIAQAKAACAAAAATCAFAAVCCLWPPCCGPAGGACTVMEGACYGATAIAVAQCSMCYFSCLS